MSKVSSIRISPKVAANEGLVKCSICHAYKHPIDFINKSGKKLVSCHNCRVDYMQKKEKDSNVKRCMNCKKEYPIDDFKTLDRNMYDSWQFKKNTDENGISTYFYQDPNDVWIEIISPVFKRYPSCYNCRCEYIKSALSK